MGDDRIMKINNVHRTICVDLDGVIAQPARYPDIGEPYPAARNALKNMALAGFKIIIHTARLDPEKPAADLSEQQYLITHWLRQHDIPHSRIIGKTRADAYIDDKAIHCDGSESAWTTILCVFSKTRIVSK